MRKINTKKGEIGSETIIIWIVVILLIILASTFLFRSRIDMILGNLPGFKGPGETDRIIDVDIPFEFDCKYPIGKIPIEAGRRTIHLLKLEDIEEVEVGEIGDQLKKTQEKNYLQLTVDGNVLYSEREGKVWNLWLWKTETKTAEEEIERKEGKPTGWSTIRFSPNLNSFIFNDWDNNLPGISSTPENIASLKEDLRILYNARYLSDPGILCGSPEIIEALKEAEKCVESCEIYGGECKDSGGEGEIEIYEIKCENNKKCYVNPEKKKTFDEIDVKKFEATYRLTSVGGIDYGPKYDLLTKNQIDLEKDREYYSRYGITFNKEINLKNEGVCLIIRSKEGIIAREFLSNQINRELEKKQYIPSMNKDLIILTIFNPLKIDERFTKSTLLITEESRENIIASRFGDASLANAEIISDENFNSLSDDWTKKEIGKVWLIRGVKIDFRYDFKTRLSGIRLETTFKSMEYVNFKVEKKSKDTIALFFYDDKRELFKDPWREIDCNPFSRPLSKKGFNVGWGKEIKIENIKPTLKETLAQCKW
jgi:hypothetical protein